MKKFLTWILALSILTLTGCTAVNPQPQDTNKLNVYTSFYAMYDFTKKIGGDKIDIENLVPFGTEPHDWEPTPNDIAKLEKADILICSGKGMEHWIDKVTASLSNKDLTVVITSDAIDTPASSDPHVWLDPDNAFIQMNAIKTALIEKDSENAEFYEKNYEACKDSIDKLDADYQAAADTFRTKDIIVAHEAYGYLCSKYGLNQVAVEGLQGESDPSPAKMAEIIDFAKTHNIRYIFFENLIDTKVLDTIKDAVGAQALVLNPFESGSDQKDYFTVMEENLSALKTALAE